MFKGWKVVFYSLQIDVLPCESDEFFARKRKKIGGIYCMFVFFRNFAAANRDWVMV